jgi:hypothetical protein
MFPLPGFIICKCIVAYSFNFSMLMQCEVLYLHPLFTVVICVYECSKIYTCAIACRTVPLFLC